MRNNKQFLTIADVAEILGISYDKALNIVKYEGLPCFTIGRQYRVDCKDLETYINRKKKSQR